MDYSFLTRSYDIRGIYPIQINEELYYYIGQLLAQRFDAKIFSVWYDARPSSVSLKDAMIQGILDAGKNVIELWLCSTDMVTFSSGYYEEIEAGIMITASHNPKEYNGIKACLNNAVPINMQTFWTEILNYLRTDPDKVLATNKWQVTQRDIIQDRINHIRSFVSPDTIKKFNIVVDAGNGTAWVFIGRLLDTFWINYSPLYFEPDGTYPNHDANPLILENIQDMIDKVKETWADLGVAFDGDADRMVVCDEKGEVFTWSLTTAAIAKKMLEKHSWASIIYNTVCGRVAQETIKDNWWKAIRSLVGHAYIKEMMKKDPEVVFAWEHSGHYFFKDNWNADSGSIAFTILLEILSKFDGSISAFRQQYVKYLAIPETNFEVTSRDKISSIYQELKKTYHDAEEIATDDGILVNYADWWFNVRPSSNEPLLRLNMEAVSQELLDQKFDELKKIITIYGK